MENRIIEKTLEEEQMSAPTPQELQRFKQNFCNSEANRKSIKCKFKVTLESYEENLPNKKIKSFATGSREIEGAFMIFVVIDESKHIKYEPVFSETVGRKFAKECNLIIPQKMTIFTNMSSGANKATDNYTQQTKEVRQPDNKQMMDLIQFVRTMMIWNIDTPKPMDGAFKDIFSKLESNPNSSVSASDIKSINTSLINYPKKNANKDYSSDLKKFINYIKNTYPEKKVKSYDFEILKEKMKKTYPDETICF